MLPPLLLPAPREHKCLHCGINSNFRLDDESVAETGQVFFVEKTIGRIDPATWELCDLCDLEYRENYNARTAAIFLFRGTTIWSPVEREFYGFESMPMLVVTDSSDADWDAGTHEERETWLFCRNREEWRSAWQIARTIARDGFWPVSKPPIPFFLPAYNPAGCDYLTINTTRLNRYAPPEGPMVGCCDGCNELSKIILADPPGSQWMNCAECHVAAWELRMKEGR